MTKATIDIERQPLVTNHKKWVCCMDCGILLEPLEDGKKKWTICKLCAEVYTKTKHPWLAKMLACHLSELVKSKYRVSKKQAIFTCNRCGSYFVNFETNKKTPKTCKWCQLIVGKKTNAPKVSRCIICHKAMATRKSHRRLVCKECIPALENIKKALKYTYYIMCRTKTAETKIRNCNNKEKQNGDTEV